MWLKKCGPQVFIWNVFFVHWDLSSELLSTSRLLFLSSSTIYLFTLEEGNSRLMTTSPSLTTKSHVGVQLFITIWSCNLYNRSFFCLISNIRKSKSWTMVFSVAAIYIRLLPVINCELRNVCLDPGYATPTGQRSPDP